MHYPQVAEQAVQAARAIHIRAAVRGLDDALLPFAVFKSNPIPDFRRYLAEGVRPLHIPGQQEPRTALVRYAWNRLFAGLRLDQVFFLCAWSSMPGASLRVVATSGLSFAISSPGERGRRWLTTRPVWRQGELVVWCEPLEIGSSEPGRFQELILSEGRMMRLAPDLVLPRTLAA
jgi:hypothetical protein